MRWAVVVAAGKAHSCAARKSGSFTCWGNNNAGQLGLGTVDPASRASPNGGDVVGL